MLVLTFAFAAALATLLGGVFAFALRDRLHLILGFSAGAVIGVAFFDLLPEAIAASAGRCSPRALALLVGAGFLLYFLLDRFALLHAAVTHEAEQRQMRLARRGSLGAASLVAHSLFDGIAVGFAFQVSNAIGLVVAAAVLAHDFSDGINTANVVLKNGGSRGTALRWLAMDAAAPAAGIASTFLYTLPAAQFGPVLAVFCGFFLYLGAADLLPESHHAHPKLLTTAMTLLGAGTIWTAVSFVG
ncbi:MAG TPA: ZIP family metal transporter [Rhizomicrobium sp.]|nr:ZIP family metal transporter [Rhizomicrobium sp.]